MRDLAAAVRCSRDDLPAWSGGGTIPGGADTIVPWRLTNAAACWTIARSALEKTNAPLEG